jgi:hypothetical protein
MQPPAELKPLAPYLKQAALLDNVEPVMAYYCIISLSLLVQQTEDTAALLLFFSPDYFLISSILNVYLCYFCSYNIALRTCSMCSTRDINRNRGTFVSE